MTRLRTHTKSHHQITITEYKERFGSELEPVEIVWHRYSVINYESTSFLVRLIRALNSI